MANRIGWCDFTFDVTGGCTECSPGCVNCWGRRSVHRLAHSSNPQVAEKWSGLVTPDGKKWTGEIKLFDDMIKPPYGPTHPMQRKKPTFYFVDSKTDLFHENVPERFHMRLLDTIMVCPQHTFMLLTKRITAMSAYFLGHGGARYVMPSCQLPNLWLGVTVCNQDEIMWKAEELGEIPAVVKFLCLEPLLDDVDQHGKLSYLFKAGYIAAPPAGRINWVIVGPETGPNRRPCKIEWIRSIVQQCRAAGVPVWVKAVPIAGRISHDPDEWDEDLRVRDRPERNR